jgi:hypothetical protein
MDLHDRAIRRFRLTLALLLTLKYTLVILTVWAFAWGTIVLAMRGAFGTSRLLLLWGLTPGLLAVSPAVLLARRRLPASTALRARVDQHSRCGGLLMAGEEHHLGGWVETLPELELPQVQWRGRRSWGLFIMGLAFLVLCFAIPQSFADLGFTTSLEIGKEVEKLAKQIEVLKEETVLDPERADSLKKKLDQVKDQASGKDPAKTLEALDHLEDVTSKAAKQAAESAAQKTEQMARAEMLSEALNKVGDALDPKDLAEAMAELAAMMQKAAAESDVLAENLDGELTAAMQKGAFTKEQLKKLGVALRGGKKGLARRIENLCKAGLLDMEALKLCESCGECNGDALCEFLKECGCASLKDGLSMCKKGGRGGITRGPGAAELTFGKPSDENGLRFKEQILPPRDLDALKESRIEGVSQAAPKVGNEGHQARAGALANSAAGGGSANTQAVLPRHRGAVERYFERPGKPSK